MKRERILITVKTYPTPSNTYLETVCTAGLREDGSWVRIYPMPYRKLAEWQKYEKYQWVELDLERNTSDFRPESHKPRNFHNAVLGEVIGTGKDKTWEERRKFVLKNVHYSITSLIEDARNKSKYTSLAVYKPKKIIDFKIKKYSKSEMEEYSKTARALGDKSKQLDVFSGEAQPFELVEKIPYKFLYHFEDGDGTKRTLMIEDWEIMMLYRNCLTDCNGDEEKAIQKVREKYFDNFAKTKDVYLFLGTTKANHATAKNPFIIIGVFYPKNKTQLSLF